MKRYLGMTEEEMLENATLWAEEKSTSSADTMQGSDLRSVGVTPGGLDAGMEGSEMPDDFDNADLEMKLRRVDAVESFDWDGGLVSSMEVASQLGFVLH